MTDVFWIVFWTLIIYSTISTFLVLITKETNERLIQFLAIGIVGIALCLVMRVIKFITTKFKYHIGKRSIFEDKETGAKYICKVSDSDDISWHGGYKRIKRYAKKSEWKGIPYFDKEELKKAKINCSRCIYEEVCDCNFLYGEETNLKCKHEYGGHIVEFDQFKKK